MDFQLDDVEARVLGCLIEKEMATPEYYPLSLNALTNACNQKSNRDPLMTLGEGDVVQALERLRFKQLAVVAADGGRVAKYRHLMAERLQLVPEELAILAELLLRGPQTVGELRNRGERMHPFDSLEAVETVLRELMERDLPFVALLPRQPGRKEGRYAQLLSPQPLSAVENGSAAPPVSALNGNVERISLLEEEVAALRGEVAELRCLIEEFRRQFE